MSDASAPVEIGQILAGKYRIDRVLGAGGMGVVVAATHLDLDQKVAIKFLLPQALANSDVVARFKREAKAAVKIQSEHVARVIDVSTLENGAPYMVMEYLEGTDLAHRIADGGKVPVADAVRYVLEACEALAEAHGAGIVHRDLKPANLFLARRADKTAIVKVLDFGISKSTSPGQGGMTSTQAVMGSPYYMSPEQLMSAKHVDARADIWSLGIVLYEALVGAPPYVADSMPEIVAQILQAPVPSVCAQRPDVPREIDRIIGTCLAKDANARYRDVAALARDLAPLTADGTRSVDRISRVLGESARPPSPSLSDSGASTGDGRGGTLAMNRSAPNMAKAATSQPDSAWGATQAGLPRKSNALPFALAGAAVLAIAGAVIAVVALRNHGEAASPQTGIVESPPPPPPPPSFVLQPPPPPPLTTAATETTKPADTAAAAPTQKIATHGAPHAGATKPPATATTKASTPPPPPPPAQTSHGALDMGLK